MDLLELDMATQDPTLWNFNPDVYPEFDSLYDLSGPSCSDTDFQLADIFTENKTFPNPLSFSQNGYMLNNDLAQSWTSPESTSVYSDDLDHKSANTSDSESATPSTDVPEMQWNSTIDAAITPEQNAFTPDLKEDSEDQEDWARASSDSPSPSLSSNFNFDTSDLCTRKKSTSASSIKKEKQTRKVGGLKRQHNDIERKYRQTINTKLAELDNWLSNHQSESAIPCQEISKQKTKGAILARALIHLQHLDRCREKFEKERRGYRSHIAKLEAERRNYRIHIMNLK